MTVGETDEIQFASSSESMDDSICHTSTGTPASRMWGFHSYVLQSGRRPTDDGSDTCASPGLRRTPLRTTSEWSIRNVLLGVPTSL